MIETEVNYLDDKISVTEQEQTTIPELIELLGTESAVVKEVVDNLRYRNKHPRVYKKASKELETIVSRAEKGSTKLADGTVKPIYESHINHVRAAFKKDAEKTDEVVTRIAQEEPLYVKGERSNTGGKIGAGAMNGANEFFAEGDEVVEEKANVIEQMMPGYKVGRDADGNVTVEGLARGLQALNKQIVKQAQAQMKGVLGASV